MRSCAYANVSDFKYMDVKMFLLKFRSELQNLVRSPVSYQDINKIQTEFPRNGIHRGFVGKKAVVSFRLFVIET